MTETTSRSSTAPHSPKYMRIHNDLAARIVQEEWPSGTPLPSQRELSQQYKVTLMTLRQALQLLEDEGVVYATPGVGTFVSAAPYQYDVGHLRSFSQEMEFQGASLETKLLGAGPVMPDPAVAARLGLPLGGKVFQIRRVRLLESRPVVLQASYLSTKIGKRLPPASLASQSLYSILADQLDIRIVRATESIRPVVLSDVEADDLERAPGMTALSSHHLSYTEDSHLVIDDIALLPSDSVSIRADRSPAGLRLNYLFSGPTSRDPDPRC